MKVCSQYQGVIPAYKLPVYKLKLRQAKFVH